PEPEPEPEPEPKPKRVTKRKAAPKPKRAIKPKAVPEPEPEPEREPEPEPEPEPAPPPKAAPQPAAIELSVQELIEAYATDPAAADAKFVDHVLKVTGAVERLVLQENLDIHYITLTNAEGNLLQNVRCMFSRAHDPELSKLTQGQIVTVQGEFDGSVINLRLKNCTIVH
ncbi:hypothetical protein ACFLTY_02950, partial [Chloroflexota bacterium]